MRLQPGHERHHGNFFVGQLQYNQILRQDVLQRPTIGDINQPYYLGLMIYLLFL